MSGGMFMHVTLYPLIFEYIASLVTASHSAVLVQSLPFMMKRMVVYFASDAHKVMTILFLDIPLLVQLELTQQLPSKCFVEVSLHLSSPFCLLQSVIFFLICRLFCLFLLSSVYFLCFHCCVVECQPLGQVFPFLLDLQQKLDMEAIVYTRLYPLQVADEISG